MIKTDKQFFSVLFFSILKLFTMFQGTGTRSLSRFHDKWSFSFGIVTKFKSQVFLSPKVHLCPGLNASVV